MSSTQFRPTTAIVNLRTVAKNYAALRKTLRPQAFTCPMVKANAYGHGAARVAACLRNEGATVLGVGLVEEGLQLRASGDRGDILNFSIFDRSGAEAMIENAITPVISNLDGVEVWAKLARERKPIVPLAFHLKINTGMNRLGLAPAEVGRVLDRLKQSPELRLSGIATHFSDAEDAGRPEGRTSAQMRRLIEALRSFTGEFVVHVSNSAAMARRLDMEGRVLGGRPGIALYGFEPDVGDGEPIGVEPVLELVSRIALIQDVQRNERVSYGGIWTAPRDSRVGVIPCGYADGYRRGLTGAPVLVRSQVVPTVGTICMDYTLCDLTGLENVAIGDPVTLIGRQGSHTVTAAELGKRIATIPYEILTGISERVPRLYVDEGGSVGVTSTPSN